MQKGQDCFGERLFKRAELLNGKMCSLINVARGFIIYFFRNAKTMVLDINIIFMVTFSTHSEMGKNRTGKEQQRKITIRTGWFSGAILCFLTTF